MVICFRKFQLKSFNKCIGSSFSGHVTQKNVANSKFYTKEIEEEALFDPEVKLINAFFDNCDDFRKECLNEQDLEGTYVYENLLLILDDKLIFLFQFT